MKQPQILLVTEKHNIELSVKDTEKGYVLEGIFAQFGVKNNNNRIYEEAEYLPHLEYLNEQIKNNNLIGELDHPEKFDVSLSKVSHIIENLTYNKAGRTVTGRIRLLDTDAGRNARKLLDGGVQLSISSRSAGIVESNNTVKLRKIFTYDLVANPGFANAQLNRVNESFGFSSESNSEINLYDFTEKCSKELLESLTSKEYIEENKQNPPMDNVTKEQLNKYSQHVSEEFAKITTAISGLKESTNSPESADLITKFAKLVEYSEYIANKVEELESSNGALEEKLNQSVDYSNYLAENLKNTVDYSNYLAENLKNSIEHSDYIAENLQNSIEYSEYVAEGYKAVTAYADYLAENLKNSIEFSEQIAEGVVNETENLAKYADYLGESLTKSILYSEHVAENLLESNTKITDVEKYTQLVAEGKVEIKPTKAARVERQEKLNESIQSLLETIEKQKEPVSNENVYEFSNNLSESNKERFDSLDITKKQMVATKLSTLSSINETIVLEAMEATIVESANPLWLRLMPENVKPVWESMDAVTKEAITRQANFYQLVNEAQVKNFWSSRPGLGVQKIEESVQPNPVANKLGYSQDYLNMLKNYKF